MTVSGRSGATTADPAANEFRDDPPLVRVTPPSPATNPTANLDPPSRRGSVNYMVDHICEPMPSTGSSELCRSLQDGGYDQVGIKRSNVIQTHSRIMPRNVLEC